MFVGRLLRKDTRQSVVVCVQKFKLMSRTEEIIVVFSILFTVPDTYYYSTAVLLYTAVDQVACVQ